MNKYDSIDEYLFEKQLKELGIAYNRQVSFIIDKGFKTLSGKNYRDSVYSPDFVFTHNDITYVIEIKGYTLYDQPFKYRVAEKHFNKLGYHYHKIKLAGSSADGTLGFYPYSSGFSSRKSATKASSKNKVFKQWFYKNNILPLDNDLTALKRPKMIPYEGAIGINANEYVEIKNKGYIKREV